MKNITRAYLLGALILGMFQQETKAQEINDYLLEMSLEDLLNMEITSVSKKSERLQDVASSIYVVNAEEIMQSGATTLHEVLRNVPGYWGVQDQYSSVYASHKKFSTRQCMILPRYSILLDGTPIQELMGFYLFVSEL